MARQDRVYTVAEFESADTHLRKAMSFEHILFLCLGSIIGSGWLFGSLAAMNDAGPAAIITWIVAGFFFIVIGLAFGEVGSTLPRSGGLARYPQITHGAYTGWILGWTYWVASIGTPAIEAEAVITYYGGTFPNSNLVYTAQNQEILTPAGIGIAVGLMILFFLLNVFGIRLLSEWNRWFTWWKILVPITTFCLLFLVFKDSNFTDFGGFWARGTGPMFQTLSVSGVAFAFLGFRQAVEFGGEGRKPGRDIPLATVLSVFIAMLIYVGLQIGMVGALDWGDAGVAAGNWGALNGSNWGGNPLVAAMFAAGLGSTLIFANFLLADAGVSPSGTGWIYLGTTARASYGLGIHGYGPRALQHHNRFGIPWVSLLIAFVVGCVFFIPAPSWYQMVGFITSTTVLTMIIGGMAVPVLRRHAPSLRRPYRLQFASIMAPAAFLAAIVIFYWAGYETLTTVYALIFVALPLFAWWYAQQNSWINPVYGWILGLTFLGGWVYLQRMGGWVLVPNPPSAGRWPFWLYIVTMAAAVVYFCVGLWMISRKNTRHHVTRTPWLIWLLFALYPVSYFGQFGPLDNPPLPFPWATLIAVGVGLSAFYWGVYSGFYTDEMREIVEAHERESGSTAQAPATGD